MPCCFSSGCAGRKSLCPSACLSGIFPPCRILCPHASLQDKDNLEEAVRKQHDLIEKQSDELKALRRQLEERDGELTRAK